MREVNFSVPNTNRASVGITTGLYDRRALDCTSTLPLINSLNHLAYLTTSSARIRDILTVDGGIERLVCILKEGRSKDVQSIWKWSLAFQCIVNIGVRGSENVRTRVVEADMVPVIATILDNYIKVLEKVQAKAEARSKKHSSGHGQRSRDNDHAQRGHKSAHSSNAADRASRRQDPRPSIETPPTHFRAQQQQQHPSGPPSSSDLVSLANHRHPPPSAAALNPAQPRFEPRPRTHENRSTLQAFSNGTFPRELNRIQQPLAPLPQDVAVSGFGLRPVREADRLPSMQVGGVSQPLSPTTPNPLPSAANYPPRPPRPSIRHQRSMSGDSEDVDGDDIPSTAPPTESREEPMVDIQTDGDMEDESMLDGEDAPIAGNDAQAAETLNPSHRSALESIVNPAGAVHPGIGIVPAPSIGPAFGMSAIARYSLENDIRLVTLPSMPRDDDVLMSLQLLAYVSKYCNLRSYFQHSHYVPRLSIKKNQLHLLDDDSQRVQDIDMDDVKAKVDADEDDEEYLLPDNVNIFPLVEKFTVRHHPVDMQYWAGVVMRNLCRKDESRGGIRQCAYYECGKWEEYTRQFAKCRRCRRTKYCSKDCQKSAWVYHRHWCVAAHS